jgi:chromosome segregation ATPase
MAKKEKQEAVLNEIVEETTKEAKNEVPTKTIEVPEKIDEQELARLQSSIRTIEQLTSEVGQIEVRKHALMKAMEQVQSRIESLRIELKQKYGTDNISVKDGVITYPTENPPVNLEGNVQADKKD